MAGKGFLRATGSARRRWLVALLAVLVAGAVVAWVALAAGTPPPAPTITAGPANPTNQTSATFTYTDSQAVTKFQCSLDGGAFVDCGTTRPSSKSYSNLAAGSHTFQVRAFVQQGNLTSAATSYSWVIDRTAPTVLSINRAGANPTNAASVSWTVTFSESVTGVAAGNFSLVSSGLSGTPALTGVSGSGASWTVSASTGTGTPSGSGTLQLRLSSAGAIKDLAGNTLGGSLPVNGQTYTIDKTAPTTAPTITFGPSGLVNSTNATFAFTGETAATFQCALESTANPIACTSPTTYSGLAQGAHTFYVRQLDAAGNVGSVFASRSWSIDSIPPPAPVITYMPDDPNGDGIANFDWTESESGTTFKCSIENGQFTACPSTPDHMARYIVDVSNDGTHQFAVRAYDAAGNFGEADYSWKVLHAVNVVADGDADGLLYPGGPTRTIALTLHNPNNFPVTINYINVTVKSSPTGCDASSNLVIAQSNVGNGTNPVTVTVPANSNLTLPSGSATRPTIRMLNNGNQDACKNGTFTLSYLATGSK
jgi:large repetitive protein